MEKILRRQEYYGDIINFNTYSKSFKNKARLESPEENWVVFKNVHEPIIDRETFDQVQKLLGNTNRRAQKQENSENNLCFIRVCGTSKSQKQKYCKKDENSYDKLSPPTNYL